MNISLISPSEAVANAKPANTFADALPSTTVNVLFEGNMPINQDDPASGNLQTLVNLERYSLLSYFFNQILLISFQFIDEISLFI